MMVNIKNQPLIGWFFVSYYLQKKEADKLIF